MNPIAHFAIHADDVERARAFYEQVFSWSFRPWGPPGFYMISSGDQGPHGSLQARHEPLTGTGFRGFECTIAVEHLDEVAAAIEAQGGEVIQKPITIPQVGRVLKFRDPEGNVVCAMRYEAGLA